MYIHQNKLIEKINEVNIVICVTFHYIENRLHFLEKILNEHPGFGKNVKVYIFTNTDNKYEINNIIKTIPDKNKSLYNGDYTYQIVSCINLEHPYNLILEHKKILINNFLNNKKFTHFLHTEDDVLILKENISYWLKFRKKLFFSGIFPSFFRYETNDKSTLKSTDISFKIIKFLCPKIAIDNLIFYNMPNPSQSNYLIDHLLADDMIKYPNNRKKHFYFNFEGIRENADIGPIFSNVPKNYISRNFVPFVQNNNKLEILTSCLIEHLPANYIDNKLSNLGKINIDDLFLKFPFFNMDLLRNIKYFPLVKFINFLIKVRK